MNVYYTDMRVKDENKNDAIFEATIQLLNEIGFAEISMSKIAKRARVSASTIYVYFENKEDMINKLYMNVKEKMSRAMFRNIDQTTPIQESFEIGMKNLMDYALNNRENFLFLEQFSNSPLVQKICHEEGTWLFKPFFELVERGIEQKLLKRTNPELVLTYCYFPVIQLVKEHFKGNVEMDQSAWDQVIKMSWDAIKA